MKLTLGVVVLEITLGLRNGGAVSVEDFAIGFVLGIKMRTSS